MISFDLLCAHDHRFEAWFRSSADYDVQLAKLLIQCPFCGNNEVRKAVMAPAIPAKANRKSAPGAHGSGLPAMSGSPEDIARFKEKLSELAQLQANMLKDSQWVGDKFADQARAMHYGETEPAVIHGTADATEARNLLEEGVPLAPLIVPVTPPDKTN